MGIGTERRKVLYALVWCLCFAVLVSVLACSPRKPRIEEMIPDVAALATGAPRGMYLHLSADTAPEPPLAGSAGFTAVFDYESFLEAVAQTVNKTGLLRIIAAELREEPNPPPGADYVLHIRILDPPHEPTGITHGTTREMALIARWTMFSSETHQELARDTIATVGVGTLGDALTGPRRKQLTMERAARQNIERGVAMVLSTANDGRK